MCSTESEKENILHRESFRTIPTAAPPRLCQQEHRSGSQCGVRLCLCAATVNSDFSPASRQAGAPSSNYFFR